MSSYKHYDMNKKRFEIFLFSSTSRAIYNNRFILLHANNINQLVSKTNKSRCIFRGMYYYNFLSINKITVVVFIYTYLFFQNIKLELFSKYFIFHITLE